MRNVVVVVTLAFGACGGAKGSGPVDAAGRFEFVPSGSHQFGDVVVNQVASTTLTLHNGTDDDCPLSELGLLDLPFDYIGGSFPGTGSDCSLLAPGASCTFIVTFSPTTVGIVSEGCSVRCDGHAGTPQDPTPTAVQVLAGTGVAP